MPSRDASLAKSHHPLPPASEGDAGGSGRELPLSVPADDLEDQETAASGEEMREAGALEVEVL